MLDVGIDADNMLAGLQHPGDRAVVDAETRLEHLLTEAPQTLLLAQAGDLLRGMIEKVDPEIFVDSKNAFSQGVENLFRKEFGVGHLNFLQVSIGLI